MGKRYYWLKLHNDFFTDKRIKKLRKIAGGDTYTVIYLKMMLKSVNNDGVLEYEGIEGTFAEELALDLDEDADNVQVTINYLMQTGLLEDVGNGEYSLSEVKNLVGSESASAQRVREYRKRQDALQCNTDVTDVKRIGNAEKENREEEELEKKTEECISTKKKKEKEKDETTKEEKPKKKRNTEPKKTYGEYGWVKLSDRQYDDLREKYSEEDILAGIEYVDYYCETHPKRGKQYSNFKAILGNWGISGGLEKKERRERYGNGNNNKQNTNSTEQRTSTTVSADPSEQYTKEQWADIEQYYEENREDLPWL